MRYDYLIVGAGFAGCVCAERLAAAGKRILLIDKRSHIGGNAHDTIDRYGIRIHPYGPHIFHTNSKRILEYLSAFTDWRFYEHRVLAEVDGALYNLPINRKTINALYLLDLDDKGVEEYLAKVRVDIKKINTSEDVVLSSVGHDLCEKFFRGYTRKQWGLDLSQLSASIASRIPTRTNDDDRYFTDIYQFMPANGYASMFARMVMHSNIDIELETTYGEVEGRKDYQHVIFTGPIDEFYGFRFGRLPYRSLRFEHEHISDRDWFQSVGTVNYPNKHQFTRITEFKHLTGQVSSGTSIVKEYPSAEGDPFYPVPCPENESIYQKYKKLASQDKTVTFVGRLAQYRYYNMDQVVGAALTCVDGLLQ
ncbi:MAG: UDP-galactopyranose mutase [Spongiibacteraceae bacterium]